jgi:hypothetical protein
MDFLLGSGVMWLAYASSAVTMHCKLCCPCLTVYKTCNGVSCVYDVLWHPQCTDLPAVPLFRQCCAHYPAKHLTLQQSHLTLSVLTEKNTCMTHTVIYSNGCNCQALPLVNMCPVTGGTSLQNSLIKIQVKYCFYIICEILWHTECTHFSAIQLGVDNNAHWTEKCLGLGQH